MGAKRAPISDDDFMTPIERDKAMMKNRSERQRASRSNIEVICYNIRTPHWEFGMYWKI